MEDLGSIPFWPSPPLESVCPGSQAGSTSVRFHFGLSPLSSQSCGPEPKLTASVLKPRPVFSYSEGRWPRGRKRNERVSSGVDRMMLESVWPSGEAWRRRTLVRFRFGSLLCLQKGVVCGWTWFGSIV